MKIEILYFAQLRDILGIDSEVLEVSDGVTAADVLSELRKRPAWASAEGIPLTVAVNESVEADTYILGEGDRVAILTPVSGG
jgi:molybdopterin synthase sulfur carrier subunit